MLQNGKTKSNTASIHSLAQLYCKMQNSNYDNTNHRISIFCKCIKFDVKLDW